MKNVEPNKFKKKVFVKPDKKNVLAAPDEWFEVNQKTNNILLKTPAFQNHYPKYVTCLVSSSSIGSAKYFEDFLVYLCFN